MSYAIVGALVARLIRPLQGRTSVRLAAFAAACSVCTAGLSAQRPTTPSTTQEAPAHSVESAAPAAATGRVEEPVPPDVARTDVQRRDVSIPPQLDKPPNQVLEWSRALEKRTGLRLTFAYTTVHQQASGGFGRRSGASGDLDIMGAWTPLGRGTSNTGQLIFSFEERHKLGPMAASGLRNEIGSLHPPTNGFDDRGFIVRNLYWTQRLLDERLDFALGHGITRGFFGRHALQNADVAFSNRLFSSNTVISSPGHGLFASVSVRPIDNLYVTVGAANAYGRTTINDMKHLVEGEFFTFTEIGSTPTIEGLGRGRYRVALWNMDPRTRLNQPGGRGFSIVAEQDLSETVHAFARVGYANGAITTIRSSVEGGIGLRSADHLTGIAGGHTERRSPGGSDETVVEAFHRRQVTRQAQFTLGVQGIFSPSNSVAVFTSRFRVAY